MTVLEPHPVFIPDTRRPWLVALCRLLGLPAPQRLDPRQPWAWEE